MFFDGFTADHFKTSGTFHQWLKANGWEHVGGGIASNGYTHEAHPRTILVMTRNPDAGKLMWLGRQARRASKSRPLIKSVPLVYGAWNWHDTDTGKPITLYLLPVYFDRWENSPAYAAMGWRRRASIADWNFQRSEEGSYYGDSWHSVKRAARLATHYREALRGHPVCELGFDMHGGNGYIVKRGRSRVVLTDPLVGLGYDASGNYDREQRDQWASRMKGFAGISQTLSQEPAAKRERETALPQCNCDMCRALRVAREPVKPAPVRWSTPPRVRVGVPPGRFRNPFWATRERARQIEAFRAEFRMAIRDWPGVDLVKPKRNKADASACRCRQCRVERNPCVAERMRQQAIAKRKQALAVQQRAGA